MKRRNPPILKWTNTTSAVIKYVILTCICWLFVFYIKNDQFISASLKSVVTKKEIPNLGPYSDALESNFITNKKP